MPVPLSISFEGAARTVTGSRHRVRFGERSWLLDCGLFQGHRDEADRVNRTFRFAPGDLDTVVLSHAHLDHSGNLPTLVSEGYRGRIHATAATADLCGIMLPDSAFLMERDVEHVNRKVGATQRPARRSLYTTSDVQETLSRFESREYHESWDLFPGVRVEYHDAGHILGSALTVFQFESEGQQFRLGMSGDLGRPNRPILHDPEVHAGVDALVLESTYGDRLHPDGAESEAALAATVTRTAARGGRVMVPSFAVGRTQEVVYTLHDLVQRRLIPDLPVYVDSPLASRATDVFRRHVGLFDDRARDAVQRDGAAFGYPRLTFVKSADESRALNDRREPCIIVSASGMCEGGRILHHLQHGLGDAKNTVLFVGFQAEGTLGRRLRDGAETVSLYGEPVRRRAEIVALDGFSAHADQRELVDWVAKLVPAPRRIFLVHGELAAAGALADKLRERIGAEVFIPTTGEAFDLWN
jgi:metallo-beta-lactamase family protein